MNLRHTALILEGGGMRGVYTAGVLRLFMDRGLYLPYVIGVSMGACNGANYVSRQPERNRIVNIRYVRDRRFMSYRRLLAGGELFGTGFIFDRLPRRLVPFDFDTFRRSRQQLVVTATDCRTGGAVYYGKMTSDRAFMTVLQAGCALPLIQKPVPFDGRTLADGGVADALPLARSIADGNRRHVVVLTRPAGYRKRPTPLARPLRRLFPRHAGLYRALEVRHRRYDRTLEEIERRRHRGEIFVIRPSRPLAVGRLGRDPSLLYADYDRGYADADRLWAPLTRFLNRRQTNGRRHPCGE